MNTKFSKSPWMVTPQGPADANGMGICSMWGEGEELMANVDLIAASPDMYAMVESLSHELNMAIDEVNTMLDAHHKDNLTPADHWDKESLHDAQVLLAKARGE